MKKIMAAFLALGLLGGFCCAMPQPAAAAAAQAKKTAAPKLKEMGGQKVSCDYFELTIPQGWSMPVPIKIMPGGVSAIFGKVNSDLAVTFSVIKVDMPAREMAVESLANMRKGGVSTGEPTERDGIWYADIAGKAKGIACFGAGGGVASACMIIGSDPQGANALLSAIRSKPRGLFPARVEQAN